MYLLTLHVVGVHTAIFNIETFEEATDQMRFFTNNGYKVTLELKK